MGNTDDAERTDERGFLLQISKHPFYPCHPRSILASAHVAVAHRGWPDLEGFFTALRSVQNDKWGPEIDYKAAFTMQRARFMPRVLGNSTSFGVMINIMRVSVT